MSLKNLANALFLLIIVITLGACGGEGELKAPGESNPGGANSVAEAALVSITAYAGDPAQQPVPSLQTYQQAGIGGVDADNLAAVNQAVAASQPEQVDTPAEIQALVDGVIAQQALTAPQNVQAAAGDGRVTLSWDAVNGATGYDICRATEQITNAINCSAYNGGLLLLDQTSPATLANLSNGTAYYFVVIPKNADGEGPASANVSATPVGSVQPPVATGGLNDTGITFGGDDPSGNNPGCTSNIAAPQDCHQGRDATHNVDSDGHAGFSFTKLDANGNSLPTSATNWTCVKDNITGLIWEVKTDDGGIHDKDNTYRWGGVTRLGSGYGTYYDDWDTLVNGSNAANFCGGNNWRVPTVDELQGIVDYSVGYPGPTIDTAYFPNAVADLVWSSSPFAYYSSSACGVYFDDGGAGIGYRGGAFGLRLVRSGQ